MKNRKGNWSSFTFAIALAVLALFGVVFSSSPTVTVRGSATGRGVTASALLAEAQLNYPEVNLPSSLGTLVIRVVTTNAGLFDRGTNLTTYGSVVEAMRAYQCGDLIIVGEGTWTGGSIPRLASDASTYNDAVLVIDEGNGSPTTNEGAWLRSTGAPLQSCYAATGSSKYGLTILARYPAVTPLSRQDLGMGASKELDPFEGNVGACDGLGGGGASADANAGRHSVLHGLYVGVTGKVSSDVTFHAFDGMQVAGIEFTSSTTNTAGAVAAFGPSCRFSYVPQGTGIDVAEASCSNCKFIQNSFHDLSAVRFTNAGVEQLHGARGVRLGARSDGAVIANNRMVPFTHPYITHCGFAERAYGSALLQYERADNSQTLGQKGIQAEFSSNIFVLRNTIAGNFNSNGTSTSVSGSTFEYPGSQGSGVCEAGLGLYDPDGDGSGRWGSANCPKNTSDQYFFEDNFNALEFMQQMCRSTVYCNILVGSGSGGIDIKNSSYREKSTDFPFDTKDDASCAGNHAIAANTAVLNLYGLKVHEGSSYGTLSNNHFSCNAAEGEAILSGGANCADNDSPHQGDTHAWVSTGDTASCNGTYGVSLGKETDNSHSTSLTTNVGESCLLSVLAAGHVVANTTPTTSYTDSETVGINYYSVLDASGIGRWYRNLYDIDISGFTARGNGTRDVLVEYLSAQKRSYVSDNGTIGVGKAICAGQCATLSGTFSTKSVDNVDYMATAIDGTCATSTELKKSSECSVAWNEFRSGRGTASVTATKTPPAYDCSALRSTCTALRSNLGFPFRNAFFGQHAP